MDIKIADGNTLPSEAFGTLTEEIPSQEKDVYTIYGMKGVGKTTLAMSFEGRKDVLSFDRKSLRVKTGIYLDNEDIHVYDAIKYLEPGELSYTKSSNKTFDYVMHIIDNIPETDWVIIDGLEQLTKICEMRMRFKENLAPFKAFGNLSLWKLRRLYIRQLHEKAIKKARKGVIYTTYIKKDEIIEDGKTTTKADIPNWIDIVMEETDVVIKVYPEKQKDKTIKHMAFIESSKLNSLKTGDIQDVTNGKLIYK